jgi:hypothetical protein
MMVVATVPVTRVGPSLGRLERSSEDLLSFVDSLRDCSVALGPIFTVVV